MTTEQYLDRYDNETWEKVMDRRAFPHIAAAVNEKDIERADRLVRDAVRRYDSEFNQ